VAGASVVSAAGFALLMTVVNGFRSTLQKEDVKRERLMLEYLDSESGRIIVSVGTRNSDDKYASLSLPRTKSFYYLDEAWVMDLYGQAFPEPEPTGITEQRATTKSHGITALFKFIQPSYRHESQSQTSTSYQPKSSPSARYNRVESYLLKRNDLLLGIEDFNYDKRMISRVESLAKQFPDKVNKPELREIVGRLIESIREAAAEESLGQLSRTTGMVIIQAEFTIYPSALNRNGQCSLMYLHPLNAHLSEAEPAAKIEVTLFTNSTAIRPLGETTLTPGSNVKAIVAGSVVRWVPETNTLVVSPIAIYAPASEVRQSLTT